MKKLLYVFWLLCVSVYANDMYFKPTPHYFKSNEIKDVIITQQCNDKVKNILLNPQQIKDFFTFATKMPSSYLDVYFTSGCYIEGNMNLDGRKVQFSIDSLGVAWIDDNAIPRAIYVCEDAECPIRAEQDDGLFEPKKYYFKDSKISAIFITKQCQDELFPKSLTPQQVRDFFAFATKIPAFYQGTYMVENCYIEGNMNLDGRKVQFSIDSLGVAWIDDNAIPRAIYVCEDAKCPIRAEQDDGV